MFNPDRDGSLSYGFEIVCSGGKVISNKTSVLRAFIKFNFRVKNSN
jgi:hypothetical protein